MPARRHVELLPHLRFILKESVRSPGANRGGKQHDAHRLSCPGTWLLGRATYHTRPAHSQGSAPHRFCLMSRAAWVSDSARTQAQALRQHQVSHSSRANLVIRCAHTPSVHRLTRVRQAHLRGLLPHTAQLLGCGMSPEQYTPTCLGADRRSDPCFPRPSAGYRHHCHHHDSRQSVRFARCRWHR